MRNLLLIGAFVALGLPAFAQTAPAADPAPTPPITFTGNVAYTTDYVFRGISQSNSDGAISGGFDLTTAAGFYAGTWLSEIDFNDPSDANLEWDVYAGYTAAIGKTGLTYNVGVYGYIYPESGSEHLSFYEIYGGLSYAVGNFTIGGQVNWSPEFQLKSGDAIYTTLTAAYKFNDDWSVSGAVGYQSIDNNAAFGVKDYTNWNVGVTYSLPGAFKGTTLDLRYSDTDDKGLGKLDDNRVYATIKKTM